MVGQWRGRAAQPAQPRLLAAGAACSGSEAVRARMRTMLARACRTGPRTHSVSPESARAPPRRGARFCLLRRRSSGSEGRPSRGRVRWQRRGGGCRRLGGRSRPLPHGLTSRKLLRQGFRCRGRRAYCPRRRAVAAAQAPLARPAVGPHHPAHQGAISAPACGRPSLVRRRRPPAPRPGHRTGSAACPPSAASRRSDTQEGFYGAGVGIEHLVARWAAKMAVPLWSCCFPQTEGSAADEVTSDKVRSDPSRRGGAARRARGSTPTAGPRALCRRAAAQTGPGVARAGCGARASSAADLLHHAAGAGALQDLPPGQRRAPHPARCVVGARPRRQRGTRWPCHRRTWQTRASSGPHRVVTA